MTSSTIIYNRAIQASLCSDDRSTRWANLSERLSHLPQEVLGELDGLVHREVQAAVADVLLNPARELPAFVRSAVALQTGEDERTPRWATRVSAADPVPSSMSTHLVGKDHQAVVGFPSDGSAHALGGVSHGVEGEEVVLPDLEVIPQVFQTSLEEQQTGRDAGGRFGSLGCGGWLCSHLQDAALRVDVRHSEHDDRSAKVVDCRQTGSCGGVGKYSQKETFFPQKWRNTFVACQQFNVFFYFLAIFFNTKPQQAGYLPKSIPSDTFPLATDSRMAPRPFSQAWNANIRQKKTWSQSKWFLYSRWIRNQIGGKSVIGPCVPCLSHLLVFLQSHARLCSVGCFDEDQLVSLDVF